MNRGVFRTFTRIAAAGAVVAGLASAAEAANATASLTVAASVANNCKIETTELSFGAYDPIGANATADATGSAQVLIACTKGATATIALGNGGGSDVNSRRLASGSNFLPYQLYREDGSTVWGSGVGTGAVSYTSISKAQTPLAVKGKILAGADVPAGTYSDTIVATVNF
jgi:spore coat protein U-like protein